MASSNFLPATDNILLSMSKKRPTTAETLSRNLDFLMRHYGYSEKEVERRSGVSAKTVNNMRNGRHKSSVDSAENVARVFGLDGWQLILPGDPTDLIDGTALKTTIENYYKSDPDGRAAISRIAEREALYSENKKPA